MNKYYLGIDQSLTKTAIVLVDDDLKVISYAIASSDKNDNKFVRSKEIAEQIVNVCHREAGGYYPDAIGIEGLPFGNMMGNVTRDLAGLQAIIISELIDEGFTVDMDLHILSPTTIKKRATGSGKAKKEEVIESVPEPFASIVKSTPKTKGRDDLADAYWIAVMTKELQK